MEVRAVVSFGFGKSNAAPIAVDFGVSRLKVLQVIQGSGSEAPTLVATACAETPSELTDKPAERLAHQAQSLASLLKGGGFRGKRAVCSIASTHALVQHVQVAKEAGHGLDAAAAQELSNLTGQDPSRLIMRTLNVGEVNRGGTKKTEVICLAMPREAVIAHMQALRQCKLEPVGVNVEHLAIAGSMAHVQRRAGDGELTTMFIDLGHATTKVVVAHGRDTVFAKTLPIGCGKLGGAEMAPAVRSGVAAPPVVAAVPGAGAGRRSKDEGAVAVAEDRRTGEATPGIQMVNAQGADISGPETGLLADEIAQCYRYHAALFPDKKASRIVFVGGAAANTDICRTLARAVRLPAQVADPLTALPRVEGARFDGLTAGVPTCAWAVALGLSVLPTDL